MASSVRPNSFSVSFFDEHMAIRNIRSDTQHVVAYARLSYDEDGANFCSIINQQDILTSYYSVRFLTETSTFKFIADDNVSGYKFERDGLYDVLRLIEEGKCNVLIAKDLSRIGRHGALVQLFIEQCERVGVRVVAMDDYDSQKQSDELILGIKTWSNERLVKDTSAKIKKIITHKQQTGTWICSAPYGYIVTNYQEGTVEIDEEAANVVRYIDHLYINENLGSRKIADRLNEEGIPTPSMHRRDLFQAAGKKHNSPVTARWNIGQISAILKDDYYTGVLRTHKYTRRGINGNDVRLDESSHHVFENHHEAIRTKEMQQRILDKKSNRKATHFRGQKVNNNIYHGLLKCGDCGYALVAYNAAGRKPQYLCNGYFRYGKSFCTRHTIKTETLDEMTLSLFKHIRDNCSDVITSLNKELLAITKASKSVAQIKNDMQKRLDSLIAEQEMIESQRIKQLMTYPDRERTINATYDKLFVANQEAIDKLSDEITKFSEMNESASDSINEIKTAMGAIEHIIESKEVTRPDVELLFKQITVYGDGRVEVELNPHIAGVGDASLTMKEKAHKQKENSYDVSCINEYYDGDPSRNTFIHLLRIARAVGMFGRLLNIRKQK